MTKLRAASSVNINIGLVSIDGGFHTVTATEAAKATQFKSICPTCQADGELNLIHQKLFCDKDHGPFTYDDVLKAQQDPETGELIYAGTNEQVKQVKVDEDIEKGVLNLSVHPANQVARYTLPGDKVHVFLPKKHTDAFGTLLGLVGEDGCVETDGVNYALVGEVRMRDKVSLVRMTRVGHQLVFQELVRPEAVKDFPDNEVVEDDKTASLFKNLIATMCEDFDPEEYRDDARLRVERFMRQRAEGADVEITTPKDTSGDLAAMLEAALAASAKAA